jgi:hypothetical protein
VFELVVRGAASGHLISLQNQTLSLEQSEGHESGLEREVHIALNSARSAHQMFTQAAHCVKQAQQMNMGAGMTNTVQMVRIDIF